MDSFGMPELLILLFIGFVTLLANRLPRLGESLSKSIEEFRRHLEDGRPYRYPDDAEVRCPHCGHTQDGGFRCPSCRRLTRKAAYLTLCLLAALAVLAVWWHVSVPSL